MKALSMLLLPVSAALLAGCAGTIKGDCAALAGPGWTTLSAPPAEAPLLLQQLNIPSDSEVVWLTQGETKVMVCDHGFGLVNPACGGSTGYQYEKIGGKWVSRGVTLPLCNTPPP